jgi:hypothetical protein
MNLRVRLAAVLAAVLALLPRHATVGPAVVNVQVLILITLLATVAGLVLWLARSVWPPQLVWGWT